MPFWKMTAQTMRNLFTDPATYMYPFKTREPFKNTRGKLNIELDKCIYCNMCARRCPTDAIIVDREKKTWQVDHLKCLYCGNCVDVCPKKCLFLANKYVDSLLRADKAKSIDLRQGVAAPAAPKPAGDTNTPTGA